MFKKIAIGIIAVLFFTWAGLSYYLLRSSNIEYLMIYATHPHLSFVPESLVRFYIIHFRGDKKDIAELDNGAGLAVIFSNKLATKYFLDFLVKKGIAINKVAPDTGGTPLTSAVIANKPEIVKYLLAHGADPSIKSTNEPGVEYIPLTPLQVAEKMDKNLKNNDRAEIIRILKAYMARHKT